MHNVVSSRFNTQSLLRPRSVPTPSLPRPRSVPTPSRVRSASVPAGLTALSPDVPNDPACSSVNQHERLLALHRLRTAAGFDDVMPPQSDRRLLSFPVD